MVAVKIRNKIKKKRTRYIYINGLEKQNAEQMEKKVTLKNGPQNVNNECPGKCRRTS